MQPAEMLEGREPQAEMPGRTSSMPGSRFDLSALTRYDLRHALQHLLDAELHGEVHRVWWPTIILSARVIVANQRQQAQPFASSSSGV